MGKRKRNENHSPQKIILDSEGNEQTRYPVPNSKKKIIVTLRNPAMPTKTISKKKSLRISWRRY
jgi:riboflavin biosynthesis pyrimidine reductase